MTIIYLGIAWLVGIGLGAALEGPLWLWLTLGFGSLFIALVFRKHHQSRLGLLLIGMLSLGIARSIGAQPQIDPNHVAFYNVLEEANISGLVVDEPGIHDTFITLKLQAKTIAGDNLQAQPVSDFVQVIASRYPVISYGTRLEVSGLLENPPSLPGTDQATILARQGIFSQITAHEITELATREGHPVRQAILDVKEKARHTIRHSLPDPEAALLTGILLGDDSGMPPELEAQFRTTGLTHIIAISGFNIAILAAILLRGSRPFVGYRGSGWVALGGIILYTILVGADAAVVRAAIMGCLFIFASRFLGRPSFAVAGLIVAGIFMTFANPPIIGDVGFQLSFAATLGLMIFVEPWKKQAEAGAMRIVSPELAKRLVRFFSDILLATLAAMLLTLPLIIYHFEQLSIISLLANVFVLPAQAGVMAWGILSTITGMVWPAFGQVLAWITWPFLSYTIGRVRFFSSVPAASVPITLSTQGLVACYIIILSLAWLAQMGRERRHDLILQLGQNIPQRFALAGSAIVVVLAVSWAFSQPDGRLHVSFLEVGQGDAIFIQTPSGRQILVDGGAYPSQLNAHLGRVIPFWDRDLDLVVASHPDADHIAALPGVFERYQVQQLMLNNLASSEPTCLALMSAASTHQTTLYEPVAGEVIAIGDGVMMEVLNPGHQPNSSPGSQHDNDASIALRLVYGDFSLLLTGDAGSQAENAMISAGFPLSAVVYKAGHHGSQSASSLPFLEAVQPQVVVVSAGQENRYGHPHPEVLERAAAVGATVLRTDELGTIGVITDGHEMWWEALP